MNILICGDSITQGFLDIEMGGWANRLHAHLMSENERTDWKTNYTLFNLGVSGDCTSRLLDRFENEAKARLKLKDSNENVVIFSIGVNDTQQYVGTEDIKTPIEQFKVNLKQLHTLASKYAETVIFVGLLPIREEVLQPMSWANDRSHSSDDVVAYDKVIEEFSAETGCLFIPTQDLFANKLENFLPDGIHPNANGHELVFERVKTTLKEKGVL